jgi:hypothetical protein
MTEEEWFAASDVALRAAATALDSRRSRLLASACCRLAAERIEAARSNVSEVAEAVERFADTGQSKAALRRARQAARAARAQAFVAAPSPVSPGTAAVLRLLWAAEVAATENAHRHAVEEVAAALQLYGEPVYTPAFRNCFLAYRDIVAEVSRPPSFSLSWRTATAVQLAKQMYESRDFSLMPILADALQDAGCDSDDVLNHCRDANAAHVRGCWVIDLVLNRS